MLYGKDQVSHPYKTRGKIIVLYISFLTLFDNISEEMVCRKSFGLAFRRFSARISTGTPAVVINSRFSSVTPNKCLDSTSIRL
jgi:hypothetical protein